MHLEAAEAASNGIGLDVASLIGGVVLAVIVGTLIPFATEQWSLWSKRRSQIVSARREALDEYEQIAARVDMEALAEYPSGGSRSENYVGNHPGRKAAYARLKAQFALRDEPVFRIWMKKGITHDTRLILASWANGENRRARRAAKRMLVEVERQQADEG